MTFGEKLSFFRKQLNLTHKELAEKLSIPIDDVIGLENDRQTPSLNLVKRLSEEFNVTIFDLLDYQTEQIIDKENSKIKNVDSFILEKFSFADSIERLTREIKLSFWKEVLDFIIGAGTLEVADVIKSGLAHSFLVTENQTDFLVLVYKNKLITKKLNERFIKKSIIVDGYKYKKFKNNKIKP